MRLEQLSPAVIHFRSVPWWFVSQSGSLPPRFSSLIKLSSTSEPSYSSKPQEPPPAPSFRSHQNAHPIPQEPQKWKNCKGKTSDKSKTSFSPAPADCKADLLQCNVTGK